MRLTLVDVESYVDGIEDIYNDMDRYNILGLGDFDEYKEKMAACRFLINMDADINTIFKAMYLAACALRDTAIEMAKHAAAGSFFEGIFTGNNSYNQAKLNNLNRCADRLINFVEQIEEFL